jgi:hypothetical protein
MIYLVTNGRDWWLLNPHFASPQPQLWSCIGFDPVQGDLGRHVGGIAVVFALKTLAELTRNMKDVFSPFKRTLML